MQFIDPNKMNEQQIAKKEKIENELVNCLRRINTTSKIKIWSTEELVELYEQALDIYPEFYSILVQSTYNKKIHKEQTFIHVGKNFDFFKNDYLRNVIIRLSNEEIAMLKVWSREGFKEIKKYFDINDNYALREVRFDFLPNPDGTFILPNLPLDSITLTQNIKMNKMIDMFEYINSKIETPEEIEQLKTLRNLRNNNN